MVAVSEHPGTNEEWQQPSKEAAQEYIRERHAW